MLTCPTCGAALDEGARFCPKDGTPIDAEPDTAVEMRRLTLQGPAVAPVVGTPAAGLPAVAAPSPPRFAPLPLEIVRATPLAAPAAATAATAATVAAPGPPPAAPDFLTRPAPPPPPFPWEQPSAPTQKRPVVPPPAPGGELCGKVIDNRYHILERISAGSVGVVYKGEHVQIHRPIAVKVLHEVHGERDDYLVRFEREALAASKMSHPACVSVLDFGTFEGRPYMVMEFVEGRVLSDVLQAGPLPLPDAVLLTRLILGALRHAHKLGVIHRDIKPANIMLCDPGRTGAQLKVLDFGLAKSLDLDDRAGQSVTLAGTICGTPGYLSPEQAAGLPLDARSDLYSVGAVLFTLVCGRRPFVYGELAAEIRAHVCEIPPRARTLRPETSVELDALIARTLAKDPADRFQSADDFIAALAELPEARGTHAAAPTDLVPVTTVAVAQSVVSPALALQGKAAPPAFDLHAAPTVLHDAATVMLEGASSHDVAEPAWATTPGDLVAGAGPTGPRPTAAGAPSQSLTTVPTTGRGKLLAGVAGAVVLLLVVVLLWYFTR